MPALPTLTPESQTSKSILTSTGSLAEVAGLLPYGIYSDSEAFLAGAVDQVAYTYKKLGGDVLDIELKTGNVYASYEEAVLEYSYIVNLHQAKNSLGDLLGNATASFNEDGEITEGPTGAALKMPRFTFEASQRVGDGLAIQAALNGDVTEYTASFRLTNKKQDYDLQDVVSGAIASGNLDLDAGDALNNNRITVTKVFYVAPRAQWRFFNYYGGMNVVGNLSSYGQYSDESTFEVVPTWQNKAQAMAYEDSIYTRISHYSYEIHNNKVRIYPAPDGIHPSKMYFKFRLEKSSLDEYSDRRSGIEGVNNLNTLPYANIPFENINSIGKQWIRRYALALSKEVLGQIRGKLSTIPIPGNNVTLNASDLLSQAKEEKASLKEELNKVLDELTYAKLAERDAQLAENAEKLHTKIPLPIFMG
ncbi:MAG TPA: hypothetical protein DG048_08500 [Pseudoalteromonas sp.]|nr:hypothetical protein [Pseudoalteromonas sp.]|tara:strand:- start:914 stop:2170 length:1257 start_codon:yes stop_codon:yes gene_type:complete